MKIIFQIIVLFISLAAAKGETEQTRKLCNSGSAADCGLLAKIEFDAGKLPEASRAGNTACDGGDMRGCNILGVIAKNNANPAEARKLFKKTCDAKFLKGCVNLGLMEAETGNIPEAIALYKTACDGKETTGCNNLGVLQSEQGNKQESTSVLENSCASGDMRGCANLADNLRQQGNKNEAKALLKKSCDGESLQGCLGLGAMAFEEKDYAEAKKHLKKPCDAEMAAGCNLLGIIAMEDDDLISAKTFFRKSCSAGLKTACTQLYSLDENQGNDKDSKANTSKEMQNTKLEKQNSKRTETEKDGECQSFKDRTYRVAKRLDETHYLLKSTTSSVNAVGIIMETQRALSGDNVRIEEATFLGSDNPQEIAKTVFRWREGCTAASKDANDIAKGTWFVAIDPDGNSCTNAVTKKYDLAPSTLMKASSNCFVESGGKPKQILFLNCKNSALGITVVYARSRQICLSYLKRVKSLNQ